MVVSVETQSQTSSSNSSIQTSTVRTTVTDFIPITATRTITQYVDVYNPPNNASATNSTLGLSLTLSMNSTMIHPGEAIKVSVSLFNVLPKVNNLSGASNWKLDAFTNTSYPHSLGIACFSPANILVFKGFYDNANVSSMTNPLQVGYIPSNSCLNTNYSLYLFQPNSPYAKVSVTNPPQYDTTLFMSASHSIFGYCNYASDGSSVCLRGFPAGTYTIVAGDEWSQIVLLHFEVYNSIPIFASEEITYFVTFPVIVSNFATEFLTIDIWTNSTSPNVISEVQVLTNASQVPHIIQFNVTQPGYIFLTEPFGVHNNGSSYGLKYAENGSSIQMLANIKAQYLYSAQQVSGLIQIEFIGPGEFST